MSNKNFSVLVDRLLTIEGEMSLLRDDKKILLAEFKEKLDIKTVQAAIRIAKIKVKLPDTSDVSLNEMVSTVEKKISI
jgi:hypothetical protein